MYTVNIYHVSDPYVFNPRKEFDNLGTMVCFHNRYRLGDKHDYNEQDYSSWQELKKAIVKEENPAVILPIYMYDHSGVALSTTPFSCGWDSGQIGWIYISKCKALEEYGGKIVTAKLKERLIKYLKNELKVYDYYLNGEVYGYVIEDENGEEVDSCTGYYGREEAEKAAQEQLMYYNNKNSLSLQS